MVYMDTEKHIWLRWKPTFFASSFPSRTSSLTGNSSPSKRGNSGISNVAQDSTSLMLHTSVVVAKTSTASSSSQDVLPSFSESRETTGVTSGILAQCSWTIPMQRRGRGKLPNSLPWLGRFRKKTLAWCVEYVHMARGVCSLCGSTFAMVFMVPCSLVVDWLFL